RATEDRVGVQLRPDQARGRRRDREGCVERVRDPCGRPALHDPAQWRSDQRVRELTGPGVLPGRRSAHGPAAVRQRLHRAAEPQRRRPDGVPQRASAGPVGPVRSGGGAAARDSTAAPPPEPLPPWSSPTIAPARELEICNLKGAPLMSPYKSLRRFWTRRAGLRRQLMVAFVSVLTGIFLVPTAAADKQPAQPGATQGQRVLTWTAGNSVTEYLSAPETAEAGTATIVFSNTQEDGNTTGMSHPLTFDTATPGYNHDVDLNITANPYDDNGGYYEAEVTL